MVVYRKEIDELVENTTKDLKNVPVNVLVNVPVKLNNTEIKIMELIKNNPNITQKELAEKINLTEKTVRRNTTKLKEKGVLKRIGADKNGYWKIIL